MQEKEEARQLVMPLQEKVIWELLPERARGKAVSLCVEMILQAMEPAKEERDEL